MDGESQISDIRISRKRKQLNIHDSILRILPFIDTSHSIELEQTVSIVIQIGRNVGLTGVRNDSATNLARALSFANSQHSIRITLSRR